MPSFTEKLIGYFAGNHLLANFFLIATLTGGIAALNFTHKEARPNLQFDDLLITTSYPGSTPQTAELLIARPLEDTLRSIPGIEEVKSDCFTGQCKTTVYLQHGYPDKPQVKSDVRNALLSVSFPPEVTELKNNPTVSEHSTANIPLIDIGIYYKDIKYLDDASRMVLQSLARTLENELTSMGEVSEIKRKGYKKDEIQVVIDPSRLRNNEISFNEIVSAIRKNSVLYPAGNIRNEDEVRVSLNSELTTVDDLKNLIIQGSFSGSNFIRLRHLARVERTFLEDRTIFKVNGRQAIVLSLIKSQAYDILDARREVFKVIEQYKNSLFKEKGMEVVYIDDESRDIRNRLGIITTNGIIGFILIMIVLFVFLDFRSGFWVGLGIPFTLAFTTICISLFGYTINSLTLAAIIIVMGLVVDDAIIIAENVNRQTELSDMQNSIKGATYMTLPIVASALTTLIAFAPLLFMPGRVGMYVEILPIVIFFMLLASLFESLFILPGHLAWRAPGFLAFLTKKREGAGHWFKRIENIYEKMLIHLLEYRFVAILLFLSLLGGVILVSATQFKFILFPREEATEFFIKGQTPLGTDRNRTAKLVEQVENILQEYLIAEGGNEVMSYMTSVARDRRGSIVPENQFTITLEIPYRHDRHRPSAEMIEEWKIKFKNLNNLKISDISPGRYNSSSGSPIELLVQSNNDNIRLAAVKMVQEKFAEIPELTNIERENDVSAIEYRLKFKRDNLTRLSVDPEKVGPTLRSILEGVVATRFYEGDDEIKVRVLADTHSASAIQNVLDVPVENRASYLVPLRQVVSVNRVNAPSFIARKNFQRTETIFADIKEGEIVTPLEIADYVENKIFPQIRQAYPRVRLAFTGEIEDSRETGTHMQYVYFAVVALVFIVLSLLFRSLSKPLIIMIAIPFGAMGVMLTLLMHGKLIFGFYAIIGALGLTGVVVNDSIVMVNKLEKERSSYSGDKFKYIASIAKTRLRAIILTTLTTAAGMFPTAYGIGGYDSFLSDMMLVMAWGLVFATMVTLVLIPVVYSFLIKSEI
ncbi:MAG: efflux RND transporter permease subunit [Leptospirales bacterium]